MLLRYQDGRRPARPGHLGAVGHYTRTQKKVSSGLLITCITLHRAVQNESPLLAARRHTSPNKNMFKETVRPLA